MFKYDKNKFGINEESYLKDAIEYDPSGELFNILTRLNSKEEPIFDSFYMRPLILIYNNSGSIDIVKRATTLDSDEKPVYSIGQLFNISNGYKQNIPKKHIDFYSALDENGRPVFGKEEMEFLYQGFRFGYKKEDIMTFLKYDKNGDLVYNEGQLNLIVYGFASKISVDDINIYAQLNESGRPKFTEEEMNVIEYFILRADEKQIQQLKESIEDGLSFDEFKVFCQSHIPADSMRIYRSLYNIGYNKSLVSHIAQTNRMDYDKLKKIKYLLTCAKTMCKLDVDSGSKELFPYDLYINKSTDFKDINSLIEKLSYNIANFYYAAGKINTTSMKMDKTIEECFRNNIEPDAIHFMVTAGYNEEEINHIASLLMDGADFNKIKELREEAFNVLSVEEIDLSFKTENDNREK